MDWCIHMFKNLSFIYCTLKIYYYCHICIFSQLKKYSLHVLTHLLYEQVFDMCPICARVFTLVKLKCSSFLVYLFSKQFTHHQIHHISTREVKTAADEGWVKIKDIFFERKPDHLHCLSFPPQKAEKSLIIKAKKKH